MKNFIRWIYKNRCEILKSVAFISLMAVLARLGFWWVVGAVVLWVLIDLSRSVK
jgi:hypothetical protein